MSWETVRLGDYCIKIGSGATPKGGATVYIEDGVTLIRSQNVYNLFLSMMDYVIVFMLLIAVSIMTYLIPANEYDRIVTDSGITTVVVDSYHSVEASPVPVWLIPRDRRKFCVIDVPRQYENLRLSQE